MKKKLITALVFAAVSTSACFGAQRRRRDFGNRRGAQQQQGSYLQNAIKQDVFAVHRMLKNITSSRRQIISHSDIKLILDDIKDFMFDAYVRAKGGTPKANNNYSKREQKRYVEPFGDEFAKLYTEVLDDDHFERMLERRDDDLDQAINLVITRHVAVRAGARQLPTVQQAISQDLKHYGVQVRGGRKAAYDGYGFDEEEESGLSKVLKYALGVGAVAGGLTGAAYGVYKFGVDKEGKQVEGFWNWMLPKEETGFFSLDKKEQAQPNPPTPAPRAPAQNNS